VPDVTGLFFERPAPAEIAEAVRRVNSSTWDPDAIKTHAAMFSERRFVDRMRAIVS
jgi:hypothetical protein